MSAPSRIALVYDEGYRNRKPQEAHVLPCHIKFSGAAPVSQYFRSTLLSSSSKSGDTATNGTSSTIVDSSALSHIGIRDNDSQSDTLTTVDTTAVNAPTTHAIESLEPTTRAPDDVHNISQQNDRLPTREAYFRGRRLMGLEVPIPISHQATIFDSSTSSTTQISRARRDVLHNGSIHEDEAEDQMNESNMEELTTWNARTAIERLVVYGNGSAIDSSDVILKGFTEWIPLACAIHGD